MTAISLFGIEGAIGRYLGYFEERSIPGDYGITVSLNIGVAQGVNSIGVVVLHRPYAHQSYSPSRMWAGGLVLTDIDRAHSYKLYSNDAEPRPRAELRLG